MVKTLAAVLQQGLEPRVLGFDDGPFCVSPRVRLASVAFAGVFCRGAVFEDMLYGEGLEQDGLNATAVLGAAVVGSKFHAQVHAVLLDGVTAGGLNVVDLPALAAATQRPVIAVVRRPPNIAAVCAAADRLPDAEERKRRIRAAGPVHTHGRWVFQFASPDPAARPLDAATVASLLDACTPGEARKVPE